jgi:hypothetical protein
VGGGGGGGGGGKRAGRCVAATSAHTRPMQTDRKQGVRECCEHLQRNCGQRQTAPPLHIISPDRTGFPRAPIRPTQPIAILQNPVPKYRYHTSVNTHPLAREHHTRTRGGCALGIPRTNTPPRALLRARALLYGPRHTPLFTEMGGAEGGGGILLQRAFYRGGCCEGGGDGGIICEVGLNEIIVRGVGGGGGGVLGRWCIEDTHIGKCKYIYH